MKTVTYQTTDGPLTIEYDETTPCICCGLPVGTASMGGTVLCPSCDCGRFRDGTKWSMAEAHCMTTVASPEQRAWFQQRAKEHAEAARIRLIETQRAISDALNLADGETVQ